MDKGLLLLSFILFLSYAGYVAAQDNPQITREILPEVRRFGMRGLLNCTVTRQGNSRLFWIHHDRSLTITTDDQVTVDVKFNKVKDGYPKYDIIRTKRGDSMTYQLVINRLDRKDNGTYICQIQIDGTLDTIQKEGHIIVLIPPSIEQGVTTQVQYVDEGNDVSLQCSASGFPQPNITWVRPNGKAMPGMLDQFSYRGNRLNLYNLTRDDRGIYRCIADNNVRPPGTYDATLYVEFRPFSHAVQSSYGQAQNMLFDLTIECIVAGFPPPSLRWYKVGVQGGLRTINDDDKHRINVLLSHGQTLSISEVWYQLTIINVQAGDYGNYKCEGSNPLGSQMANVYVYETSECQGANCPSGDIYGRQGSAGITSLSWSLAALILVLSLAL